jgi:hypothetical protein
MVQTAINIILAVATLCNSAAVIILIVKRRKDA